MDKRVDERDRCDCRPVLVQPNHEYVIATPTERVDQVCLALVQQVDLMAVYAARCRDQVDGRVLVVCVVIVAVLVVSVRVDAAAFVLWKKEEIFDKEILFVRAVSMLTLI